MMPIVESIRKGRSRRIGVGIGLNALGPVSRTVLVDCNYHFLFRMKDHESLWEATKTLVLLRGAEAILPGLEPGECLFRGPAWPDATLVQIHANLLPPLRQDIQYDTLPYVRSRSLREMPPVLRALQEAQATHKAARLVPGNAGKPNANDPPMQFLSLACDMVGLPAAYVFEAMGHLSSSAQAAIRRELEMERLALFETWRIERTSRLLQEVTQEGASAVGKTLKGLEGRGSTVHRCAMWWIKDVGNQRGYPSVIDPVQRRNALLAIAGACMAMAVVQRPSLLLFFTSVHMTVHLAVSVVAAFFMALAIREFALAFLHGPGDPWYAKPGAVVFLAICLPCLNVLLTALARIGPMASHAGPILHQPGMRFQLTAFEVLWIVLLEWVSYDRE